MTSSYNDDSPVDHAVAHRLELKPISDREPAGKWVSFVDFLRQHIGLKPLHLSERWAEAKVRSEEIDNEARLINAKLEYEKAMAEVRRLDAETDALQRHIQQQELDGKVGEMVRTFFSMQSEEPDESLKVLSNVIQRIRDAGGEVEIDLPGERET